MYMKYNYMYSRIRIGKLEFLFMVRIIVDFFLFTIRRCDHPRSILCPSQKERLSKCIFILPCTT